MAVTYNLTIDQGTDFFRTFTVVDNDNVPVNITGFSISGKLKKSTIGANNTAIPFVITITDAVTGKVKMELSNITTDLLIPGRYVYDIELINTSNKIFRIVEGIITVNPNITKI
jgi:hypothetical protein